VAQLGARLDGIEEVVGSNPIGSTNFVPSFQSDSKNFAYRTRACAKVIIENGERPVAVLHAAEPVRRSISECIALAKAHEEETSKAPVLDPDFAEDLEEIIIHRKPWNPPAWE
jgi:hypothetical protein